MIRISQTRERSSWHLLVEGTLSGVWVDELERCWLEARRTLNGEPMCVDLSGVSFVDDKGRRLLAQMFQAGVELRAAGVMTRGIIEEITGEKNV